jgi:prepilin-type N-terminal cleavage/methylation domain-containing protein
MKKGFTLIELLIVIALLGTLAVALLAAIDPFEQFKKGTDTGVRNTTQEFYNAAIRYYAQRNGWPAGWPTGGVWNPTVIANSDPSGIVGPLISAGELKANFVEIAESQLDKINIAITGSTLLACFQPVSKSMQNADSNTKYISAALGSDGQPQPDTASDCKLHSGTADCYWCIY